MPVENKTSSLVGYQTIQDRNSPSDWRVEHLDIKSGDVLIAIFSGISAEERAQEYAEFKNRQ